METVAGSHSRTRFSKSIQWLRRLLRKHWFLTLLLGTYLLFKLLGATWSWVLTPIINPHPKDSVTIRGTFPFDKGLNLYPTQEAVTTTHWVNRICGIFVSDTGIPCQGGWRDIPFQKLDATHYEITFYRDYYLPGIAGWRHAGMGYSLRDSNSLKRGGSGFPNRTTAVKCFEESKKVDRDLTCVDLDNDGADIYSQATRQANVNFFIASEGALATREKK